MKFAIGCDHGGFNLKESIKQHLKTKGIDFLDCGTYNDSSVDYPDYAREVTKKIVSKECEFGILICGTGLGISIAANKVKGIRAAVCTNTFMAKMSRMHNNANILALGERVIGVGLALEIVDAFIEADFEGGRHEKRVDKITELEKKDSTACCK